MPSLLLTPHGKYFWGPSLFPNTNSFCTYVGYVFVLEICFTFCKHEVLSTQDLIVTKDEANILCKIITYISTKRHWCWGILPCVLKQATACTDPANTKHCHTYIFQDMMDQCAMPINMDRCAIKF